MDVAILLSTIISSLFSFFILSFTFTLLQLLFIFSKRFTLQKNGNECLPLKQENSEHNRFTASNIKWKFLWNRKTTILLLYSRARNLFSIYAFMYLPTYFEVCTCSRFSLSKILLTCTCTLNQLWCNQKFSKCQKTKTLSDQKTYPPHSDFLFFLDFNYLGPKVSHT